MVTSNVRGDGRSTIAPRGRAAHARTVGDSRYAPRVDDDLVEQVRVDAARRLDQPLVALWFDKWDEGSAKADDLHPHIRHVVWQAVVEATPRPDLIFEPRDNSGARWAIIIGAVFLVGGLLSVADAPGWGLLGAGFGLFLAVSGSRNWTSATAYAESIESQKRAAMDAWKQERVQLSVRVADQLFVMLHRVIGHRAGVPDRVLNDFARESIANANLRKAEGRLAWWAAQPEYPPAPGRRSARLGHDAYETYCAEWMRSVGWVDADVTRYSRDGGIDVETGTHAVQCKHYDERGYVGAREVREIYGVAQSEQKQAVVITSGRFTRDATDFAARVGVALIHLDELNGEAKPLNAAGVTLVSGPTSEV